ncbi:site-specific DNA-methyltransferase [Phocaeicola barnesiae]|uniref:site-specific DNA-methyltransferase n=1 Tax=Phocaeicola barnesiae TaxID=376804 RepID=UPI00266F15CC|nr:site-specific DNA-methyltransferase [Phocaeicola barnesiae]
MDRLKMQSLDVTGSNIKKIQQLFPNCVTERLNKDGKPDLAIDFEKLQAELSNEIIGEGEERYQFTWPDKRVANRLANTPTTMTLRPCREESVNFDHTQNLYIEGDNLDVLKALRETYLGKVKIIYIDPPYNTGNDFVYNDDFAQSRSEFEETSGLFDEEGNQTIDPMQRNAESNGRFHTDWLNMLYPRLKVARDLLSDDGVIFISIDDNEEHNLRKVCDEIFGESCFVSAVIWKSSDNSNNDAKQFSCDHNTILIYSKRSGWEPQKIMDKSKRSHFRNPDHDPNGPWFDGNPLNSPNYRENLIYNIVAPNGNIIRPPKNGWRWSQETLNNKMRLGEIYFNESMTNIKRRTYLKDMKGLPPSSLWVNMEQTGHNRQAKYELLELMPEDVFDTPKPLRLIRFIISLVKENTNSIILDFFSGSGTTAHAVMQANIEDNGNRKFILVQLPENLDIKLQQASNDNKQTIKNAISLCDKLHQKHLLSKVAIERIRRAGKKIKEDNKDKEGIEKLDIGFRVLKLDSSNMEDVYYTPQEFTMQSLFNENVKADRTGEDLLFQVMLDLGIELSAKVETQQIAGKTVYLVDDNYLVACFDRDVTEAVVTEIAKLHPIYFVMRDASAANDNVIDNFEQLFEAYSKDTVRKIL